jgi:uncharacterized protein involved in type VI secretion and phage assembly
MTISGATLRTPVLDLLIGGTPLPERLALGITALRVQQHLSQPSACELTLLGIDEAQALQLLQPGAALRVAVRHGGGVLFDGRISAVEAGYGSDRVTAVVVRAFDALLALRNRQTARAFVDMSAADLARELVTELDLTVQCDEPGPAWPRVLPAGTDFDVLADIAERSGLYFMLQERTLWLHTLQGRGAPIGLALNDNLYEARFEANANGAALQVDLSGWNPWRGSEHQASADSPRGGRTAALQTDAREAGGGEPRHLQGRCLQGDEQAHAIAQSELDLRRAQSLVMWGTAAGDARLRPGVRVRIGGVAAKLAGEYVLCSVHHVFDAEQGYVCELSSAVPAPRVRDSGTMLALGQVTRIDDPDRLGRVQVALPAHGNVESDWLQLVAAGAGKGKGLVAQPDVGDRVLLLMERADPAQAVVLGSLWGEDGMPEEQGGLGEKGSFCFVTPGGHRLRLDDGARTVRIRGSAGSELEMGPERVTLHAAAPMTIEAPGQRLTIRAAFIDFQRSD